MLLWSNHIALIVSFMRALNKKMDGAKRTKSSRNSSSVSSAIGLRAAAALMAANIEPRKKKKAACTCSLLLLQGFVGVLFFAPVFM